MWPRAGNNESTTTCLFCLFFYSTMQMAFKAWGLYFQDFIFEDTLMVTQSHGFSNRVGIALCVCVRVFVFKFSGSCKLRSVAKRPIQLIATYTNLWQPKRKLKRIKCNHTPCINAYVIAFGNVFKDYACWSFSVKEVVQVYALNLIMYRMHASCLRASCMSACKNELCKVHSLVNRPYNITATRKYNE